MRVIEKVAEMQAVSQMLNACGKRIGFVPTMGALHDGHVSLVRAAKKESDAVVVSIFVNPTQFSRGEDFSRYPRSRKRDLGICRENGVDFVFFPSVKEIYPRGFSTTVSVGKFCDGLEGKSRPGHFDGVATIVAKLFNIVCPSTAFFGRKDFEQSLLVKRIARDLNIGLGIVVCPTVRDSNGLALSSRNNYLSPKGKKAALVLFRALQSAKALVAAGERRSNAIEKKLRAIVSGEKSAKIDYAAVRDSESLKKTKKIVPGKAVALLAVRIGRTRLIDNEAL